MPRIQLLSDRLISQIAAGEVVERPASVVKELLENSLDAGARRIEIELSEGGKHLVEISDDGCGMDAEDAVLAFDRHATSKLAAFEDLERIGTLGFRGEALASIAAVATVRLETAARAGEGFRVEVRSGRMTVSEPLARKVGTRICVRDLFEAVPARREFLKRDATELRRCVEVVQGYALTRPDVHFELRHAGRELLMTRATGVDLAGRMERIAQLFGDDLAEHLVPLEDTGPPVAISGFVGDRETTRGRRIFTTVNGRTLRDRAILAIFYKAVRDLWGDESQPALFLSVELDPLALDVNVHPQKAEVRFRDPSILGRIGRVLRRGLEDAKGDDPAPLEALHGSSRPLIPAWEGLGNSATGDGQSLTGEPTSSTGRIAEVSVAPERSALSIEVPSPLSGRGKPRETLRILGQYKGTMILLEGPDALLVIDQHVAHERILFEQFRDELAGRDVTTQRLLEPEFLELSAAESLALIERETELESCGFELASLDGGRVAIVSLPAAVRIEAAKRILRKVASRSGDEKADEDLRAQLIEEWAASQACRGAVKMHHPLTVGEMERLISDLFSCEHPHTCPHGRPVVLRMTDTDLERRFGRR